MNPFLIGACLACWVIFIVAMILSYLDKGKSDAGFLAVIFFILCIFLTIAAGGQWEKINHPAPVQMEKGK